MKELGKINNQEYDDLLLKSENLAKQLGVFIKKLRIKSS